jgi:branched-subunit amino acid transport protein
MTALLAFVLAALVTWLLRSWMTLAGDRVVESDRFAELTSLVTPAVLSAMVASAVLLVHGELATPRIGAIAAVGVAFLAVRRTGNVGLGLVLGLAVNAVAVFGGLG